MGVCLWLGLSRYPTGCQVRAGQCPFVILVDWLIMQCTMPELKMANKKVAGMFAVCAVLGLYFECGALYCYCEAFSM